MVMGYTTSVTDSHSCLTCNSTYTVGGTDYMYLYNWTSMAKGFDVNYCIENANGVNKT
jgi:hypothetical protein